MTRASPMKVAIVGVGAVGPAAASALLQRGSGVELILVDRAHSLARSVALDLDHAMPISVGGEVRASSPCLKEIALV